MARLLVEPNRWPQPTHRPRRGMETQFPETVPSAPGRSPLRPDTAISALETCMVHIIFTEYIPMEETNEEISNTVGISSAGLNLSESNS